MLLIINGLDWSGISAILRPDVCRDVEVITAAASLGVRCPEWQCSANTSSSLVTAVTNPLSPTARHSLGGVFTVTEEGLLSPFGWT